MLQVNNYNMTKKEAERTLLHAPLSFIWDDSDA